MSFELLQNQAKAYHREVLRRSEAKDRPLEPAVVLSGLCSEGGEEFIRRWWASANQPFERFAIAKHLLSVPHITDGWARYRPLAPEWLYACLAVGAYPDCIALSEGVAGSEEWRKTSAYEERTSILFIRAKAFRNLGEFEASMAHYRQALEAAVARDRKVDVSRGLLLVGKLYGSYRGQRSLFVAFVQEAKRRLQKALHEKNATDEARAYRYIAICDDSLGQALRDVNVRAAEAAFRRALRVYRTLGDANGVSRVLCHISYLRCMWKEGAFQEGELRRFEEGLRLLVDEPLEERGAGVRLMQYAQMRARAGRGDVGRYLDDAEDIAGRYSDYRTLARVAVARSELEGRDAASVVRELANRRALTQKYGLQMQEAEVNARLAELGGVDGDEGVEPHELIDRNRQIFSALTTEVQRTLDRLESREVVDVEFRLFSVGTRNRFKATAVLDFQHMVNRLTQTVSQSIVSLRVAARRQREELIRGVMNSVAREVLHETKAAIPMGSGVSPLITVADLLDGCGAELRRDSRMAESVAERIGDYAERVRAFGQRMERLKRLLADRLRKPRELNQRISIRAGLETAIIELEKQGELDAEGVVVKVVRDIEVTSDKGIVTTALGNLVRNASEMRAGEGPGNAIVVMVDTRAVGDRRLGNPAREGIVSVMVAASGEEEATVWLAQIEGGLLTGESGKEFGSGVGLELGQMVFRDLLRGRIEPIRTGLMVGVRVCLPVGTLVRIEGGSEGA